MQDIKKDIVTKQYASSEGLAARIRFYARYNPGEGGWWKWTFTQIQEALGEGPKSLLEIGCGRGDIWKQNTNRIPKDWNLRLSDSSPAMMEAAKELDIPCSKTIEQLVDAVHALRASPEVNGIVANHMLYCLSEEERREALSLAADRLRMRNGSLCTSTNGLKHLAELWQLLLEFDPSLAERLELLRSHLTFQAFSKENGEDQLKKYFSQIEWREYANTLSIDDADSLADFFCSFHPIIERLQEEDGEAELRAFLARKIKTHGPIKTQAVSGMFIARP